MQPETDPITRLMASYGIPGDRLVLGSKLNVEGGQIPTATITFILEDIDFRVMAGQPAQTQHASAREVQHVDTDEPEASGIPPHVWLYRNMLSDLQAVAPLGRDETNGQYAVAIDDLTDEQRAIPHVAVQLARMEVDRAAASTDRLTEALRGADKLYKGTTST